MVFEDMRPSRDAFKYFEYGMTSVGWLPGKPFYQALRVIMLWVLICLPLGTFINYAKEIDSYTPGEFLTSMQASVNAFGTPVKCVIVVLNMWRYLEAKELLNRLDEHSSERAERSQINYGVRRCDLIYLIYQVIYSGYIISTYFTSVFNGVAPWRIYNPFVNWRASTRDLWIASTVEFFLTFFTGIQEQLTDVYPLLCCTMMRVHINLLQQRVQKLRTDPTKSEPESFEQLARCIGCYQLIQGFADVIRPIISRTIFIQFLLIGVCLGAALVNLLIFADFWSGVATVAYIAGLMVQTFPFCYTCDLVRVDCEILAVTIFQSNWVGASRVYKSTLINFLQSAQKPIAFTAGSIFPVCMQTNIQVAKLAFSVVTFVQQMNLAEKMRNG